ncbi:hypothetical protein [Ferrimonas marina]|uniref:Uncharacterized protein n=1 Tax=Ferrimonas marina TaxID=299255 RepID=A0A1M5SBA0_9GAMM|nr:hypothetical protein [Ferrimonas marina]SHH35193.1 hypothetical protein SAMN02745129_1920 [Ferrimonas marina]
MGLFDLLSESKIRDWLARLKPAQPEQSLSSAPPPRKRMESHLLEQIQQLQQQPDGQAQARELEIQLLASLERRGYNLMARHTAEQLQAQRQVTRENPADHESSATIPATGNASTSTPVPASADKTL